VPIYKALIAYYCYGEIIVSLHHRFKSDILLKGMGASASIIIGKTFLFDTNEMEESAMRQCLWHFIKPRSHTFFVIRVIKEWLKKEVRI